MSAPDSYIPFYGNDFFSAVEGEDDDVAIGYLRAIWNYWNVTHCNGLRNESEFLRKICRVSIERWPYVEKILFDGKKFMLCEDGKWHQKRAEEEWIKSMNKYKKAIDAANVRWSKEKGRRR